MGVTFKGWLDSHQVGSRELVQGLKGDATYLIVDDNKQIRDYGINAVCTYLGCVVPWNKAANKYMCPCRVPVRPDGQGRPRAGAAVARARAHHGQQRRRDARAVDGDGLPHGPEPVVEVGSLSQTPV